MNTNLTGFNWFKKIFASCALDESSLSIGWKVKVGIEALQMNQIHKKINQLACLFPKIFERDRSRVVCTNLTLTLLPLSWDLLFESVPHRESTRDVSCSCSVPERETRCIFTCLGHDQGQYWMIDLVGGKWEWGWCILPLYSHRLTSFLKLMNNPPSNVFQ